MKKKIRIITNTKEIQKYLEKLYDKIDLQILLYKANTSLKNSILLNKETEKLKRYNLDHTASAS